MYYTHPFLYYFLSNQVCGDKSVSYKLCQHVPKFFQKRVIIPLLFHGGKLSGSKIGWSCGRAEYVEEVITLLQRACTATDWSKFAQFGPPISVTVEVKRSAEVA